MKKILACILVSTLLLTFLASCSSQSSPDTPDSQPTDTTTNIPDTTTPIVNDDAADEAETTPTETPDTPAISYITSRDDFLAIAAELVDLSLYDALDEDVDDRGASYYYSIAYENEIEYALDYSIALSDGTTFTMPYPLPELLKSGWTISESMASTEIESFYMSFSWLKNHADQEVYIHAYNPTDDTITFGECSVCSVEITLLDLYLEECENALDFTVCDSITQNSTLEDIIAQLGNPSSISYWVDYDDNGNYESGVILVQYVQPQNVNASIEFSLCAETNRIASITYSYIPR